MTEFFNRRDEKDKRRRLRREMTLAEALLWPRLRDRQTSGWKFRRQHSAGVYILDFYCPACQLAVELDGESHASPEAQAYDAARTEFLGSLGIQVIRFANRDVFQRLDVVVKAIWVAAAETDNPLASPSSLSSPSPFGRRGSAGTAGVR